MQGKTVRFESDDKRSLELWVGNERALARVGDGETFPFSFENLGYVANGLSYQAWASGSHFAFRRDPQGFRVEFQGPNDRSAAILRISAERMGEILGELNGAPVRATLL